MKQDGKPRSSLLKMLMVDASTFNTFLAEFSIRATARLLQPWNEDSLVGLLGEHRPDVVVFENAQRSTVQPLAARLAAASPEPFLPVRCRSATGVGRLAPAVGGTGPGPRRR